MFSYDDWQVAAGFGRDSMMGSYLDPTDGEYPESWELTTLGVVCARGGGCVQTGPFGSQLHASDYKATGIPVIMPVNIGSGVLIETEIARISEEDVERLSRHKVKVGDVIYSRRGDVRRCALVKRENAGWLCGTGCLKVDVGMAVLPEYAGYYLQHPAVQDWIERHSVGSTMPNLNTSILSNVPFVVPPADAQNRIVEILSAIDERLEFNRKLALILEGMAQTLFKSWFVDFDPVVAKSEARNPFGMSDEIAALFPDSFADSEVGPIPKGWYLTVSSQLLEILSGGTPKTSVPEYWGGNIPWFSVVDTPIEGDVFVLSTEKTITDLGVMKSAAEIYPIGTTIITARGTVGNVAMMGVPMAFNQSCYGLLGKDYITTCYTYFLSKHIVDELQLIAHGSVFDTITRDSFDSVKVCKPPEPIVARFSHIIDPLLNKIRLTVEESKTLRVMRDLLLPKLLSGEFSVNEPSIAALEATAA